MPKAQSESPAKNIKTLADAIMQRTLQRAHDDKLRRGEAHSVSELMQAFKNWSDGSQRCELDDLVVRAQAILEMSEELKAQRDAQVAEIRELAARIEPSEDFVERATQTIRKVVTECMDEWFAAQQSKRRRSTPKLK